MFVGKTATDYGKSQYGTPAGMISLYEGSHRFRAVNFIHFPVDYFRAGSVYLFRLVAVYSNNDNKHGRNSDRFFLSSSSVARSRGPSSAPVIVDIQALSDTVISVRWQVRPSV